MRNILDILENVSDEKSFIEFMTALYRDNIENRNEWQNTSADNYLEACLAWYNDSKKHYTKSSPTNKNHGSANNPWRTCAELLYSGKVYE